MDEDGEERTENQENWKKWRQFFPLAITLDLAAPLFVVKTLQPGWFYGSWISPQLWMMLQQLWCCKRIIWNVPVFLRPESSHKTSLKWVPPERIAVRSTLPPWDPEIGFDSTWIRCKAIISTSTFWRNMSCKWATCATCPAWRTLMLFWKDGGWDFRKKENPTTWYTNRGTVLRLWVVPNKMAAYFRLLNSQGVCVYCMQRDCGHWNVIHEGWVGVL